MLKAALLEERMPAVARKKDWVVFCKHLDLGPEKAIAYLRRYLQHVLPKGFNKVRRYGLFAPGNATRLKALRYQLLLTEKSE